MISILLFLKIELPKYCESMIEHSIFNTPFNVFTNLFVIFAGFALLMLARQQNKLNYLSWLLINLALLVGTGSGIFHAFPNHITYWFDVIPIFIFQITFILIYSLKILNFSKLFSSILTLLFAITTILPTLNNIGGSLNDSVAYIPTLVVLIFFSLFHYFRDLNERYILILSSVLFLIGLIFRIIDLDVCHAIPIGTHFLWHTFIALVIYFSAKGVILNLPSARQNTI